MALELLAASLGCYGFGAVLAAFRLRWRLGGQLAAAAGVVAGALLVATAALWLAGAHVQFALPVSTPLGGFQVHSTRLGGLFLLLTGVVGVAISMYSSAYAPHVGGPPRQAVMHGLLDLTSAAMVLVVAANTALTLLLAWELMSVLTYLLVAIEYEHPDRSSAALLMLALSELGFIATAVAFALIGQLQPGQTFAQLAAHPLAAGTARDAAFPLFLFGFGAKAGLLPLQGWLPEAHPAAPSNVSALLSAVVVKMGIYGLILTTISLLGVPAPWWGYLALTAGVLTAIYGILYSLLAWDLKRALAFSTVENLGFMVAMLGAALVFRSADKPVLEAMALVAMTLHALYHSLYKGALFMGAGSVNLATGTRDMDQMGGLNRRMPWTGALFFLGAMGLGGIPPLGGFQTEWLGLQALLRANALASAGSRVFLAAAGALLTLTFALAVTTYIRIYGGSFLGVPRSHGSARAVETPLAMRLGIALPIGLAVVMALVPPLGVGAAAAAVTGATRVHGVLNAVLPPIFIHPAQYAPYVKLGGDFLAHVIPGNGLVIVPTSFNFAFISPPYILIVLVAVIGLVALALRLMGGRPRRDAEVWAGGISDYRASFQYTATGFTNPMRVIFGSVYQSRRQIEGDYRQAPHFARSIRYVHHFVEPVDAYLYAPLLRTTRGLSRRLSLLQSGSVSLYLLYVVVVFIVVLLVH
ncbi:MAG: proton-conducting transporter membrane subunit [Candidatus Dormibacteria bacterium]